MITHASLTRGIIFEGRRLPFPRAAITMRRLSLNNHKPPYPSMWKTLKAPALFGLGLYIGLMAFGEHQETKEGSAFFQGLRSLFWVDKNGQKHSDNNGVGNDKGR